MPCTLCHQVGHNRRSCDMFHHALLPKHRWSRANRMGFYHTWVQGMYGTIGGVREVDGKLFGFKSCSCDDADVFRRIFGCNKCFGKQSTCLNCDRKRVRWGFIRATQMARNIQRGWRSFEELPMACPCAEEV